MKRIIPFLLVELCYSFGALAQDTTFVLHLSGRDIGPSIIAAELNIGRFVMYNEPQPFTPSEIQLLSSEQINRFDRIATRQWSTSLHKLSDITGLTCAASPFLVSGLIFLTSDKKQAVELAWISMEAASISLTIMDLTKNMFNRPRPYLYNANVPAKIKEDPDSRMSFFSGHTSMSTQATFTAATILHYLHPEWNKKQRLILWTVATALPASVAFMRVAGGKHFPSDVIVGYAVGALIGWATPVLHLQKFHKKKKI